MMAYQPVDLEIDICYSPGARGSYPALRVKVFFFADSGSPEGRLQFLGGWPSVTLEQYSESTRLCWAYTV